MLNRSVVGGFNCSTFYAFYWHYLRWNHDRASSAPSSITRALTYHLLPIFLCRTSILSDLSRDNHLERRFSASAGHTWRAAGRPAGWLAVSDSAATAGFRHRSAPSPPASCWFAARCRSGGRRTCWGVTAEPEQRRTRPVSALGRLVGQRWCLVSPRPVRPPLLASARLGSAFPAPPAPPRPAAARPAPPRRCPPCLAIDRPVSPPRLALSRPHPVRQVDERTVPASVPVPARWTVPSRDGLAAWLCLSAGVIRV